MFGNRSTFFFALALTLSTACVTQPLEPEATGIPDRSVTDCQKAAATNLGPASSVFTCRGRFVEGPSGYVAAYKGSPAQPYSLLSVNTSGDAVGRRVTDHAGETFVLAPLLTDVFMASWSTSHIRYGLHGSGLGGRSARLREIEIREGRVLDVAVVPVSDPGGKGLRGRAEGGALVAAATGFGIETWLIDRDGAVIEGHRVLEHPEMMYCDRVEAAPSDAGFTVRVRCDGVLPLRPDVREQHAWIRDFNWGAKIEGGKDITVELDVDLRPTDAALSDAPATPAPARYALRRFVEDQLPRRPGARARVLDAIRLGERRYLSLACIGTDDEEARIEATVLTCIDGP